MNKIKNEVIEVNPIATLKTDTLSDHSVKQNENIRLIKQKKQIQTFVPDIGVNNKLYLSNYESLPVFYSNYNKIKTVDRLRESPVIVFANISKDEYLIAYQYEGGVKNSFDCFEIGYFKDDFELNKIEYFETSEENFKTETNLYLGLTLDELEEIKGLNYEKKNGNESLIITYKIDDFETSDFLQKYNMPVYFMEFTLKNNKIIKLKFGFEYP